MSFWGGIADAVESAWDFGKDLVGTITSGVKAIGSGIESGFDAVGDFVFGSDAVLDAAAGGGMPTVDGLSALDTAGTYDMYGMAAASRDIFSLDAPGSFSLFGSLAYKSPAVAEFLTEAKSAFETIGAGATYGAALNVAALGVIGKGMGLPVTGKMLAQYAPQAFASSLKTSAGKYAFNMATDALGIGGGEASGKAESGVSTGDATGGGADGGLQTGGFLSGALDFGRNVLEQYQAGRAELEMEKFRTDQQIRENNALYNARTASEQALKARFNPQGYMSQMPGTTLPQRADYNQQVRNQFQGSPNAYQSQYQPMTPQEILERQMGLNLNPQV